jgi:hypothetical protein
MNGFRLALVALLMGTGLVVSGCGKAETKAPKSAVEHTDDDGHDQSEHEDHSGHNH